MPALASASPLHNGASCRFRGVFRESFQKLFRRVGATRGRSKPLTPGGSGGSPCRRERQEPVVRMPMIKVKDNESFEQAMKRFKKQCEKAGVLTELRRREFYDKPSVRRKKKAAAARKRALKKLKRMAR